MPDVFFRPFADLLFRKQQAEYLNSVLSRDEISDYRACTYANIVADKSHCAAECNSSRRAPEISGQNRHDDLKRLKKRENNRPCYAESVEILPKVLNGRELPVKDVLEADKKQQDSQ